MDTNLRIIHKKTGNFLEDFGPGQILKHRGGKTVTEGLMATFGDFSFATHPFSKNRRYAQAHGYRDLVCPPGLVMLVAFSQTVGDISENARANLEYINMRFGAPVYAGDTLEVETKILGVRTSSSRPNLGIVHVQSTARKNIGSADEAIVLTFERKVQVFKGDEDATVDGFDVAPDEIECELWLPKYGAKSEYEAIAHLGGDDGYFEDFEAGTLLAHSRGRTVTSEHIHLTGILDNTSQVHCNQHMIDLNPSRYLGGQLVVYGGIPFSLCLGISGPDIGDNTFGDSVYKTGRHTAPLAAGETVFASTEILATRDHPEREDLGIIESRLFGHKFDVEEGAAHEDAPAGYKKTKIFELDREVVVKRRSHYGAQGQGA